jgi:hypothetical protein
MTTLIVKDKELNSLLDSITETQKGTKVRQLIAEAIEKAYKAGVLEFNAFDHTCLEGKVPWYQIDERFNEPILLNLISTYLKENGYVD